MAEFTIKTKIHSGRHSLQYLNEIKNKKVQIVCDQFLATTPIYTAVLNQLNSSNQVACFTEVTPDPSVSLAAKGVGVLAEFRPDIVIAVGGGSAIDAAKAMLFFSRNQGIKVQCFIAIPTTSGTGSEVTPVSVLVDTSVNIKYPLIDDSLYPDIAILDPELVLTVPSAVTANTGIDALVHAIEAYVARNASEFTDALAEKSVNLIFNYLYVCWSQGNNCYAREKMMIAANLAGIAFSHAGLGITHSIAHQLGGKLHVPHGLANSLLICHVIRYNGVQESTKQKYAQLARRCGIAEQNTTDDIAFNQLVGAIENLQHSMNMPSHLSALNHSSTTVQSYMDAMADAAVADLNTPPNPRPACKQAMISIINKII